MKTRNEEKSSRRTRGSILGAIGAALALIASALVPTAALAAPPQAGTYQGTSDAYTNAHFSFDIDANGVMSNFDATSYCFDGWFTQPVVWAGGPSTPIEAGQAFDLEWESTIDGFGTYYELSGTVNADGTASGTGRAGFVPTGTCGGSSFTWTASIGGDGGDPAPQPGEPTVILEKESYYDYEIQRVGIMIRGEGFPAETDVNITIHQDNNGTERLNTTVRSDVNGVVYHRYVGWLEHQPLTTWHTLTMSAVVDGEEYSDEEAFTADPGGDGTFQYFHDREMSVSPQSISQSEFASDGVHVASTDMDGREDTAELIVDGKVVGEVPVAEIPGQFGEVDYQFIDASLPVGVHEVALRTVHVDDSLNPRTWERVAWDTFTVTEDAEPEPDPTPVTPVAPTRDGNTVTIPSVDGLTYRDGSGTELSGTVTLTEGQTLEVKATADDGYVLTDDVSEWTFVYEEPEPDPDPDPIEVTATAPTQSGNIVSIPAIQGVTYVDDSDGPLSGDVTLTDGQTLTVTATADDGYVLADGTHEWTFTYEEEDPDPDPDPDPIEVTAAAPTQSGNTVTIPVVEGVIYVDGSDAVLSGGVTLADGQTLVVTATADDGYVLADGVHEWEFTYEEEDPDPDPDPDPIEVTATAPTQSGNTVSIPEITGVTYLDGDSSELSGDVILTDGQTLTVSATADEGYVLADGTHEWTFSYEEEDPDPDPVEVTATAPTQSGNTVTIPVVEGVTYVDGSDAVLSGDVTLADGQTLTVTATADDGYVLADGTHEWEFTYEEEDPDPDPVTIPAAAPVAADLDPLLQGAITAPDTAEPGEVITITIEGATEGDEVGIWFFSDPVYLGAHTVSADGTVTVTIPADAAEGDHSIAAWAAGTEAQIGWDFIAVAVADDGGDDENGGSDGDDQGGSGDTDGEGGDGADDQAAAGGSNDPLASTGASNMGPATGLGLLLVLASAGLLLMRRRRTIE